MDTDSGDSSTYAARLFNASDGRQVGVYLLLASDPRAGFTAKADLGDLITATEACPPITVTDEGVTKTLSFDATASDSYGEFGADITAKIHLEGESLPSPITIHTQRSIFRVGDVDAMVQSTCGIDRTGREVRVDPMVTARITADLDHRLVTAQ